MKKIYTCLFFVDLLITTLTAQDSIYYRQCISDLSSRDFHGRGYAYKGDSIAADYIAQVFKTYPLEKWTPDYYQHFTIGMNVFDGEVEVDFGQEFEQPRLFEDLQIMAYSCAMQGQYKVKPLSPDNVIAASKKKSNKYKKLFLLIDLSEFDAKDSIQQKKQKQVLEIVHANGLNAKGYILVSDKLMGWPLSLGRVDAKHVCINVSRSYLTKIPKQVRVKLDRQRINNYQTQNVCGYIKGKTYPDSFFVFTAHYDHLGHFGKDYIFYGANDNASGTAFIMDLARYYSKAENQPDYSIAFLALSCEEVGLLGSFHFVENSYIPISTIKTLINFDMVGTGEEGITLVCGHAFPYEFEKFAQLNTQHQYLNKVVPRHASNNSDHYPFYEKGVQAFFIYAMGKSGRYHHTSDTLELLSLGGYTGLFKLITAYINLYNQP